MIVRSPTACPSSSSKSHCSEHTTIDFRETGPTGSNSTMFKGRPLAARVGGLAVGVPGELRGLEEAHKRWGVLPWERLVKPSIQIAKSSKTSKELERRLKLFGSFMLNDPDWKESFINKDTGSLLVEGDVLKREAYAKTLEKISKNGPGIFYEGEIAKSLVEKVQSKGGILTLKDLKDYKAKVSSALEGSFQGKKVWTTNAPTSGPVLLSLLNILEGFPNYFSKKDGLHSGLNNHLLIESMKFSSAQRTEIADPDFLTPHALKRISEISTKREADLKRSNISFDRTHDTDWYQPVYDVKENHGTMHLSVVDKNGMAVALTSTVNLIFGSQVLDPKTGIILNDEMDDNSIPGVPNAFGLYPSPYNYPAEGESLSEKSFVSLWYYPHSHFLFLPSLPSLSGKRPLSSMAPSILENSDGSFYLAIGGSGGSRIFPAIGSVLTNLEFGLDLSSAIERPRIHHQLLPPQAQIETGYDEDLIESLKSRGHEILMTDIDWALSEVQAVMKVGPGRKQVVYGASDSRKGGIASAY